jgi:uncharacterized protein
MASASAQAPYVKTRYGVAPAKMTLWAQLHEPLSDADIARVNLELYAKGNRDAAWELGLAYMQGLGVPQDFAKAEQMFQVGAVDADRKGMVGMFYAHGYFPSDLNAVERWYNAAGRPRDKFELAETFKAAAQNDKSVAPGYYARAAVLYLALLKEAGHPEIRRAQLELGNFVIDGIYSSGGDPVGRAQNLEWARMIAQELLGQKESQIAVEYKIGEEDLPKDEAMSLRYSKRAAAYNIDGAQHSYVEAISEGKAPDLSGYDYVAWTRLAAQKQTGEIAILNAFTASMSEQQLREADAAYQSLVAARSRFGAYYAADDPLRDPAPEALAAMAQDDPDVQLREAFSLEKSAIHDEETYERVLSIYRNVRDHRDSEVRFVLGRYALNGANGVPKNRGVAEYWLREAIRSGSKPAQQLLDEIESQTKEK